MSKNNFGFSTTAMEVVDGVDLHGYEAIVTGAASGIGVETARALAKAGARVVIAARDIPKAQSVADDITKSTGNKSVEVEKLELDSLESVRDFVKRYLSKNRPLHILINNAGVMACPLTYTKDGFENQFGTNHLGHFVLTVGLLPALKAGYKASGRKSRVVSVSSMGHTFSDVNFDDVNFKSRPYEIFQSYGQSKTANILFAVELTNRFASEGVVSNALMPGAIMTNLMRHMDDDEWKKRGWVDENGNTNVKFKTTEQGASTSVWAAVAPELENRGGLYLEDCGISSLCANATEAMANHKGYLAYAVDPHNAKKLWDLSEKMTGM